MAIAAISEILVRVSSGLETCRGGESRVWLLFVPRKSGLRTAEFSDKVRKKYSLVTGRRLRVIKATGSKGTEYSLLYTVRLFAML